MRGYGIAKDVERPDKYGILLRETWRELRGGEFGAQIQDALPERLVITESQVGVKVMARGLVRRWHALARFVSSSIYVTSITVERDKASCACSGFSMQS